MARSMLFVGGVVGVFMMASSGSLGAAELETPALSGAHVRVPLDCGPCGCLQVEYVYHRELRSTYGLSFDPRNFDTTEPYYYFGPMRRYPRFRAEGWAGNGPCR